jgi:epoxyqueuosine reductase
MNLLENTDPAVILPGARSIIVLIEDYCREAFPASLVGKFGRCYMDDDRMTRDGWAVRIKEFRDYLRDNGIHSKVPAYLPHRLAAARAGLGTLGKNCLFFSRHTARQGSWVLPVPVIVDAEFEPDPPTVELACPAWCRNACIAACPTGALKGQGKIDPQRCISYLTYYGEGITPRELREPMGMWVYGCDRCQNVCPRNQAWMAQDLPSNVRAAAKAEAFDLRALLFMDEIYFKRDVQPHMFYMSSGDIWRWKMNVARAMGNSRDRSFIPDLIEAFGQNEDERVQGMIAWALGILGGTTARCALSEWLHISEGLVREEVASALEAIAQHDRQTALGAVIYLKRGSTTG